MRTLQNLLYGQITEMTLQKIASNFMLRAKKKLILDPRRWLNDSEVEASQNLLN